VGCAKVESKKRFPLSHSPCYGYDEVFASNIMARFQGRIEGWRDDKPAEW
jgi:hypothetical protein